MPEQFIIMSADYTVHKGTPLIMLFARNLKGKREFAVNTFRPYFYAPIDECSKFEGTYQALDGKIVGKLYTALPSDVPKESKRYSAAYEDKILFPVRFLIDKGIRAAFRLEDDGLIVPCEDFSCRMSRMMIDIEVEVSLKKSGTWSTIEDALQGRSMILSIVAWDDITEKYYNWNASNEEEEELMLGKFLEHISTADPDTISGWNVAFDITSIINRCRAIGLDPSRMSPMGYVDVRDREVVVLGRNVFDLREGFRKYFQGRTFDSYALEQIAERKEFLSFPVDDFDYQQFMNREHIDMIIPYNTRDVERCVGLDKLLGIIDHFDGLRRAAGCRLIDTLTTGKFADVAVLREYHGKYVLGTKGKGYEDHSQEEIEGAIVLNPVKGIHKYVILMDFSGMYPTIILSNNLSPECITKDPEGAFEINGYYFKKEPRGIIPVMIEKLFAHRKKIKKEMKGLDKSHPLYHILDLQQYSVKQIMASIYGYMAYRGSRIYYPQISASITFMGRKYISMTVEFLKSLGYEILYGDTDSMMLRASKPILEGGIEEGKLLEEKVNEFWRQYAEKIGMYVPPTIEFEIGYDSLLLSAKKRYAGICSFYKGKIAKTPELIIRGFEARRSDSSLLSRKVQTDVLRMILEGKTESDVRKYIRAIDITKLPFEEVGIPDPLRQSPEVYKNPASILHVFFSNKYLGKHFQQDSRPYIFWVKKIPEQYPGIIQLPGSDGMKKSYKVSRVALENEDDLKVWRPYIDWELQAEKILFNKLEPILSAFGLSISELKSGQKQVGLDAFMG